MLFFLFAFFLRGGGATEFGSRGGFLSFSLAKEEYNQNFVFRMLCNILEQDIDVSRDFIKQPRLIKSVQFLLFQIFLSLY